jgi:hypothetical protein
MSYSPLYFAPQGGGTSIATVTNYTNATISMIAQGTPVSTNTFGLVAPTDVTSQTSVQALVGYAQVRMPASSSGPVISNGRLENIMTSFAVGDAIYIGLGGTLINQKPDVGVAGFVEGDFVVFVGVLVQNQTNPSLTDIQLFTQTIGEL